MANSATRSFSEDQAAKTGVDARTVRRDAERDEQVARWIKLTEVDAFQNETHRKADQTARNMMRVADLYGDKVKSILNLAPTALYALAAPSTPEPVRERVHRSVTPGCDCAIMLPLVMGGVDEADFRVQWVRCLDCG